MPITGLPIIQRKKKAIFELLQKNRIFDFFPSKQMNSIFIAIISPR